jgi:RHS repeat-associated protein
LGGVSSILAGISQVESAPVPSPSGTGESTSFNESGDVTATGGKSFTYDSENHLVSMSGSGTSATFEYDAFGNRVAKTVNGVTTQYLVDDLNPTGYPQVVDELNTGGAVTRTYTYGLQRISENLSPALTGNSTWTPSFYGYDGGGNVRQLTNLAGSVTDSYEYDAYGNSFTVSGTTPNEMMYRGEQYDSDLGLYYLRARYYNPLTGRFVSMDPEDGIPTDPKSLHKYTYAGGDPMNAIDPTGKAVKPGLTFEYGLLIGTIAARTVVQVAAVGCAVDAVWELTSLMLEQANKHLPGGYKLPTPPPAPPPLRITCVVAAGATGIGLLLALLFGVGPG